MQCLNDILKYARERNYSDVHFGGGVTIKMRENGVLLDYEHHYSVQDVVNMILSMLNAQQIELLNAGKDVDMVYVNETMRYRVNVFKERGQVCASIRVIYEKIRSLEELNIPTSISKLCDDKRGLVLITGPTGSGKSTTLAALIDKVNQSRKCHILTIEDPIEYVYQMKQALIHQREIGMDVENFDTALRSAMREDPDVILVGEMRDYETIQAVLTLAETGHLVFSTLHTIGAAKTIDRIVDVFPPHKQEQIRTQLAGVLNAVVTQSLLPTADGRGRVAAFEIMMANSAVRNLIRENKVHQINSVIQTNSQLGMQSLNMNLVSLLRQGKITRESAEEFSNNPSELAQLLNEF